MFNKVEQLLDKILPDLARGAKEREETTQAVVNKSARVRRSSEDAMFEAYRRAGIAIVTPSPHRRWED
jgi:hypothetical protein